MMETIILLLTFYLVISVVITFTACLSMGEDFHTPWFKNLHRNIGWLITIFSLSLAWPFITLSLISLLSCCRYPDQATPSANTSRWQTDEFEM